MILKRFILLAGLLILIDKGLYAQEELKKDSLNTVKVEYLLDDKLVSKKEFENFQKKLKQIDGTYHCKKMVGGGANSYEAKDRKGVIYDCYFLLNKEKDYNSIKKK